jgi:predicted flap endonuclease-1-like 5' DNA nuclease
MILSALATILPLSLVLSSENPPTGLPFYIPEGLAFILFLIVTVIVGLALIYNAMVYQPPALHGAHAAAHGDSQAVRAASASGAAADDLKLIEGIGPKIADLLHAHGIHTFAQLASTPPNQLEEILKAANLRIADPTTWPEQASLAAAGDWERFNQLVSSLKGGRR